MRKLIKAKRQFDFVGKRKLANLVSVFYCLCGHFALFSGLNLGIDFTRGTAVELAYEDAISLEDVRASLKNSEYEVRRCKRLAQLIQSY